MNEESPAFRRESVNDPLTRPIEMARRRALTSDATETAIAAGIEPHLTDPERNAIVLRVLAGWVWEARRERALAIERASVAPLPPAPAPAQPAKLRQEEVFAEILSDPGTLYGGRHYLGRRRDREAFSAWCGDRFGEWLIRARPIAEAVGHGLLFDGDWHPDGPTAARHEQTAARIADLVDSCVAELRMQWTAELLNTKFAIGDGRRVTWGEATVADHEQRAAMLEGNATANAEAAARHRSAVRDLQTTQSETLSEMVAAAPTETTRLAS